MAELQFPSLSEDGWIRSSVSIADSLFAHFFVAEYSQTHIYNGAVSSFPWIIQETHGDVLRAASLTQDTLHAYFSRFFSDVSVEVSALNDPIDQNKASLTIYVSFKDHDGTLQVLGKLLKIVNSKATQIINLSNTGSIKTGE
jgi:hypothetical protein